MNKLPKQAIVKIKGIENVFPIIDISFEKREVTIQTEKNITEIVPFSYVRFVEDETEKAQEWMNNTLYIHMIKLSIAVAAIVLWMTKQNRVNCEALKETMSVLNFNFNTKTLILDDNIRKYKIFELFYVFVNVIYSSDKQFIFSVIKEWVDTAYYHKYITRNQYHELLIVLDNNRERYHLE